MESREVTLRDIPSPGTRPVSVRRLKDPVAGEVYGFLKVIGSATRSEFWTMQCKCKVIKEIRCYDLLRGYTTSCGCRASELTSERNKAAKATHGHTRENDRTLTYRSWDAMRQRCSRKTHAAYSRYGGAGITVHPEWDASFEAFLRDVGPRPSKSHSIDRYPNPRGNYEPGNVRWATKEEQNTNRIDTLKVQFEGEELPLKQVCNRVGIGYRLVWQRLNAGWSLEKALFAPLRGSNA
jgi:hypothetical protein